jgi:hypothetical protein
VPRTYDPEFRRRVVEFVWAGRPVRVVAAELGLAEDTFNSKQRTWVAFSSWWCSSPQVDGFRRLLGTTELNMKRFAEALLLAIALLAL